MTTYIPLHILTNHSIGKSLLTPEILTTWAETHNVPALGIVDVNTLEGALTLSETFTKAGVQPLIGVTLTVTLEGVTGDMLFYARNAAGQAGLLAATNLRNTQKTPLDLNSLVQAIGETKNVIVLTGDKNGLLARSANMNHTLATLKTRFPHLFVELARLDNGVTAQDENLQSLAETFHLPLIATIPADHATHADQNALDTYMCIVNKTYVAERDRTGARTGSVLVSPERAAEIFADVPEALANTVALAKMCQTRVTTSKPMMPVYRDGVDAVSTISEQAQNGLKTRLEGKTADTARYTERLAYELDVITRMGYADYFLIVADFIGWARKNDIAVGPGRGSGAGSLVAYALEITDIDPIEHNLLFERFLNPDRVSLPDFDVDFCQNRREEVIAYVRNTYGAERVAHIGTYGTLKAKAVVRAVGRVMGLPYPVVNRFAGLIPDVIGGGKLADALNEPLVREALSGTDQGLKTLFETALKIEGLWSHTSVHAAGVVIAPKAVGEVVPVYKDESGTLVTAYDMHQVEKAGLIKFDFLGLKNLDILQEAVELAATQDGANINLRTLRFDDPSVYAQLSTGDGFGVFQVESFGMRQAMKTVKVDRFADVEAILALYRPGPMDNIETYAKVKHGDMEPEWAHESLKTILEPTHGVMIYQEQVMQAAQALAGYTLAQADLLRRAMGKKNPVEMDAQRDRFVQGAMADRIAVTLEDGRTVTLHPETLVAVKGGNGQTVCVQDAIEQGLDVVL